MVTITMGELNKKLKELEERMTKERNKEIEKLRDGFNKRVNAIENKFATELLAKDQKISGLTKELGVVRSELTKELEEVQKSAAFVSDKLDDSDKIWNENKEIEDERTAQLKNTVDELRNKNTDLEDRSRRSNLIFYNIPEEKFNASGPENCENKIIELVRRHIHKDAGAYVFIDRAHRLGKREPRHDTKPRPVIVKFTYYKDAQNVLHNGICWKGTGVNISQDYSRDTVSHHKELFDFAKNAKTVQYTNDPKKAIVKFNVLYKRLSVTYTTDKHNIHDAKTFRKTFTLADIKNNRNAWFIPPPPRS
jgi:hypothetical protein